MKIEEDIKLDFDDVLLKPKRSTVGSRQDVDLLRQFKTLYSEQTLEGIPIIAANMFCTGTFAMAKVLTDYNISTAYHKFYTNQEISQHRNLNHFYSIGITDEDINKLKAYISEYLEAPYRICVDVANGYSSYFVEKLKLIRALCPQSIIMGGNVCTAEMVQELIISGKVDIVKCGIGPGSTCQTRKVTGVGFPQLSCALECADAAHGLGGLVCIDGGMRTSGDIAKAYGAGADFVMLGGMLAGCEECAGTWDYDNRNVYRDPWGDGFGTRQKKTLNFYGMSSEQAMITHYGEKKPYKASEGISIKVPYKGFATDVIREILGGLRSACTYVGARRLKDLSKCATFIRVNRVHYQNV